jgi:penicillin-binding protein 1A
MALGAGSVTAWQLARAYSVFANGGFLIQPYFMLKVVDDRGNPLALANPIRAGEESLRVIDRRNAFIMDNMMQDTMRIGTGARAARLGRNDLAGKTGTTNEFVDAWFAGYQPNLVAISWVGFDQPKTLGRNQTGSVVALPIWIGYMEKVLKEMPETPRNVPDGIVTAQMQILPPSGEGPLPPQPVEPKLVPEYFYQESVPPPEVLRPLLDAPVPPPAVAPPAPPPPPVSPPA